MLNMSCKFGDRYTAPNSNLEQHSTQQHPTASDEMNSSLIYIKTPLHWRLKYILDPKIFNSDSCIWQLLVFKFISVRLIIFGFVSQILCWSSCLLFRMQSTFVYIHVKNETSLLMFTVGWSPVLGGLSGWPVFCPPLTAAFFVFRSSQTLILVSLHQCHVPLYK